MKQLEVEYAGLKLKNPIIVSSSGLTNTLDKVVALEKAGAGAVVLKSLFEEQIRMNADYMLRGETYVEADDYVRTYVKNHDIQKYLELIRECKKVCTIPIIASINCYTVGAWSEYARDIETAGADAIEINIFRILTSKNDSSAEYELLHYDILNKVRNIVGIPVIVKLGQQFTNLVRVVKQLQDNDASAVVLFNRFFQPDINLAKMEVIAGHVFSTPSEFSNTLRWTGIVSGQIPNMHISSSTGIHEPETVVKALLAGAQTVQICSAIYQQGNGIISQMLTFLEEWMNLNSLESIADFRASMNFSNVTDQALYERSQFMKYYSSLE